MISRLEGLIKKIPELGYQMKHRVRLPHSLENLPRLKLMERGFKDGEDALKAKGNKGYKRESWLEV